MRETASQQRCPTTDVKGAEAEKLYSTVTISLLPFRPPKQALPLDRVYFYLLMSYPNLAGVWTCAFTLTFDSLVSQPSPGLVFQVCLLPIHSGGEGDGTPLQCSCLENPRDSRAWWAAVCGVTQSGTWLRRLSSSIHSEPTDFFVCASATPTPTAWFLQLQPTPGIAHYCYLGDLM